MAAIIGTWKMSASGVFAAYEMLRQGAPAGDAATHAVTAVEDDPAYRSVGFGGLPDAEGRVRLDAAYMDGDTLRFGAVMSAQNLRNPVLAARLLCGRETNCVRAGEGAERFALKNGLALRDMRTEASMARWRQAVAAQAQRQRAYEGHDTVCVLALDGQGGMTACASTSGLFMKEPGRVGDTPLPGCGVYCDSRYGAAAATGLGEDIMRGCLSYEAVSLMRRGADPQSACLEALRQLTERKLALGESAGSISLIALSPDGAFGAATTLPVFPYAAANNRGAALYAADAEGNTRVARDGELDNVD